LSTGKFINHCKRTRMRETPRLLSFLAKSIVIFFIINLNVSSLLLFECVTSQNTGRGLILPNFMRYQLVDWHPLKDLFTSLGIDWFRYVRRRIKKPRLDFISEKYFS